MTPNELFWKHSETCDICDQHPQSVASFFYESMCGVGRNHAVAMGMFDDDGPPDIASPVIYIQESVGYEKQTIIEIQLINKRGS